ncbi:alpha/beta fold hydrolase [Nocardia caishijiensis]|uniref:Pimeloyl-ACP methyl ester carboxylesterase n=1 Tax=Nocardia caishijiensis TaxID=184756 RepID=A0ABQ6YM82_9NOCA|nr:alpha/beta fold hydrolase [Nocardia caishijiensis]KAF0846885.1 pimeloyl-ACP methyl ester carboxylesterase [Nocardia caishijiensis]
MTQISHHRRGTGAPIVLVHGLGSRWQVFAPIIDELAETHEVIAVDLPGFGDSPLVPGVRPGPRGYAAWLTRWLADNAIHRPHVVGSSMGGGIALELGRTGVASAVTAFSPVGFYGPAELRWTKGLLTGMRGAARGFGAALGRTVDHRAGRILLLSAMFGRPALVSPPAARLDLAGLAGASAFTAARDDFDNYVLTPAHDLGALTEIPVTIAWGTRDVVLVHRTQSARARTALPFARHHDLPGCGHLPFSDAPHQCARLILERNA